MEFVNFAFRTTQRPRATSESSATEEIVDKDMMQEHVGILGVA